MQRTYVTVCGTSVSLSGRRFRGLDCAKPRPPQREAQRSGEYSRPVSGLNLRGRALFLMGVSGERGTWVRTTRRRTGMSGWGKRVFLLKRRQISHRQISIQLGRFLGNFSPDFSEISPLRTLCSKCAAIRIRLMSKKAGT